MDVPLDKHNTLEFIPSKELVSLTIRLRGFDTENSKEKDD